jgi:hypothetical protein
MWSCRACGIGNALGHPGGLCNDCAVVAATIRAEQAMTDTIGGRTRRDVVAEFLARTASP